MADDGQYFFWKFEVDEHGLAKRFMSSEHLDAMTSWPDKKNENDSEKNHWKVNLRQGNLKSLN